MARHIRARLSYGDRLTITRAGMLGVAMAVAIAGCLMFVGSAGAAPTCCATIVTVHDPDGAGPLAETPVMHKVPATVRLTSQDVLYAIDLEGLLAPLVWALPGLPPGYELKAGVSVPANLEELETKPKITIENPVNPLTRQRPVLPVRVEVASQKDGVWSSFGYDALKASAPGSFVADIDTSARDNDAMTDQAKAVVTLADPPQGANKPLTVVSEKFTGDPAGARANRAITRLGYVGDGGTKRIPAQITADLTTPADVKGAPDRTHAILTRDPASPTRLDFEVTKPARTKDGVTTPASTTTGRVDVLPEKVDITIAAADVQLDGPDGNKFPDFAAHQRKIDYTNATSVAGEVVIDTVSDGDRTHAEIAGLPTDAHLTAASPTDPEDPDGQTQIVYDSNGRAKSLTVENEDRTGVALKRTTAEVDDLPADVTLKQSSQPGENHINYQATHGANEATVEVFEDEDTTASTSDSRLIIELDSLRDEQAPRAVPPLPTWVKVDAVRTETVGETPNCAVHSCTKEDKTFDFDYTASGEVAKATINGTNLKGLPARTHNLNLQLRGIPADLHFGTVKHTTQTGTWTWNCDTKRVGCPDLDDPEDPGFPECDVDHPPPYPGAECEDVPTKTTTTTTTDDNIDVSSTSGRLDFAAVQLTSLPFVDPLRLPPTAKGKPQEGILTRDIEGGDDTGDSHYLIDARITGLASAAVTKHGHGSVTKDDETDDTLGGNSEGEEKAKIVATAHPDTVVGIDQESGTPGSVSVTRGLLAGRPGSIELTQLTRHGGGTTKDVRWQADQPVAGFCESSGGPACAANEVPVPAFKYQTFTRKGDGSVAPGKTLSITPMHKMVRICKQDVGTLCTESIFSDNIQRLANGDTDHYKCFSLLADTTCTGGATVPDFPLSSDKANKGSVRIEAPAEMRFDYLEGDTSIVFPRVTRFALQGDKDEYSCGDVPPNSLATCQDAYLALDNNGQPLEGDLRKGEGTHFHFPPGWNATQRVWSGWKSSWDTGHVAAAGGLTCPPDAVIDPGEKDLTEQFCHNEIFGEGDLLDIDF